jgi:hypothetical protein
MVCGSEINWPPGTETVLSGTPWALSGPSKTLNSSVADPGSLSRIPDPDFHPSRIQKQHQKKGVKKNCCHTFYCSHKFHKIENYFIFEMLKKKNWAYFQRIIKLFTQKIVTKLFKIWVWDPGSEIQDPEKTYPGYRGQKGTGSGSAILLNRRNGTLGPALSVFDQIWRKVETLITVLILDRTHW